MVLNFKYEGGPKETLLIVKEHLQNNGYDILHYAPEAGYILTDYKKFNVQTKNVYLALSINIRDVVVVLGMGKYDIITSGIGNPDDMIKTKSADKLPYKLQKKIFLPIATEFKDLGLNLIKTRR